MSYAGGYSAQQRLRALYRRVNRPLPSAVRSTLRIAVFVALDIIFLLACLALVR